MIQKVAEFVDFGCDDFCVTCTTITSREYLILRIAISNQKMATLKASDWQSVHTNALDKLLMEYYNAPERPTAPMGTKYVKAKDSIFKPFLSSCITSKIKSAVLKLELSGIVL
jgi:hypothetical protein